MKKTLLIFYTLLFTTVHQSFSYSITNQYVRRNDFADRAEGHAQGIFLGAVLGFTCSCLTLLIDRDPLEVAKPICIATVLGYLLSDLAAKLGPLSTKDRLEKAMRLISYSPDKRFLLSIAQPLVEDVQQDSADKKTLFMIQIRSVYSKVRNPLIEAFNEYNKLKDELLEAQNEFAQLSHYVTKGFKIQELQALVERQMTYIDAALNTLKEDARFPYPCTKPGLLVSGLQSLNQFFMLEG